MSNLLNQDTIDEKLAHHLQAKEEEEEEIRREAEKKKYERREIERWEEEGGRGKK